MTIPTCHNKKNENLTKHENPDFAPLSMMPLRWRWHCWRRRDTLRDGQSTLLEFAHRQGYSWPDEVMASWWNDVFMIVVVVWFFHRCQYRCSRGKKYPKRQAHVVRGPRGPVDLDEALERHPLSFNNIHILKNRIIIVGVKANCLFVDDGVLWKDDDTKMSVSPKIFFNVIRIKVIFP